MKKACLLGLLAWLLAGCWSKLPPPFATTPRVSSLPPGTRFVATPEPSATPAVCTDLPEGAALIVTPLAATQVQVVVHGMQPGERLRFQFIRHPSPKGNFQIEDWRYLDGVKADGSYTVTQGSLEPAPDSLVNAWTIKVIHARGVACQEIVLPMP